MKTPSSILPVLLVGAMAASAWAQAPDSPAAPAPAAAPDAPAAAPDAPAEAPDGPAAAPDAPAGADAPAPATPPAAAPGAPAAADPATPLTADAPPTDVDPTTPPPIAPPAPVEPPLPKQGVSPLDGEGSAVDEVSRRSRRLADELRSPFCPGKTLMTCTSYQAFELRREMREMIERGMSDAEIIDTLVLRHGEEVRNPPQPWYTILVPVLPFIVLGVLLFWIFRKWKERDQRTPEQAPQALDPEDAERLARLRELTKAEFE